MDHGPNSLAHLLLPYFDNSGEEAIMNEASVFELDPKTFRLTRQISRRPRAWQPSIKTLGFRGRLDLRVYRGASRANGTRLPGADVSRSSPKRRTIS